MCASRLKTRNMRSPRCCACVLFAHLCVGGTGKWYSDYLVVFERSFFFLRPFCVHSVATDTETHRAM